MFNGFGPLRGPSLDSDAERKVGVPKTLVILIVDDDPVNTPVGCKLSRLICEEYRLKPQLRATFAVSEPSARLSVIRRGGNESQ
jgi:hypothetical protein